MEVACSNLKPSQGQTRTISRQKTKPHPSCTIYPMQPALAVNSVSNGIGAFALATSLGTPVAAQGNFDQVEIKTQILSPGVAVLFGAGGNIAISHGVDNTIMIDDQFAPLSAKIEAAVEELGAEPVSFVVNTHWHYDHTGGDRCL